MQQNNALIFLAPHSVVRGRGDLPLNPALVVATCDTEVPLLTLQTRQQTDTQCTIAIKVTTKDHIES